MPDGAFDACVHDLTTLQMLLDVLREQEVYSVTTLSLRYCALRDDGVSELRARRTPRAALRRRRRRLTSPPPPRADSCTC